MHLNVSRSVVAVHLYNCARALSPKTKLEPRALSVLRVRVSIFYGAYKWLQHDNRTPCTITGRTSPHQRGQPRNWDVLSKVRRIRNSRRYTHSRRVQLNPTNDGTCSPRCSPPCSTCSIHLDGVLAWSSTDVACSTNVLLAVLLDEERVDRRDTRLTGVLTVVLTVLPATVPVLAAVLDSPWRSTVRGARAHRGARRGTRR